jgi:TolB-like protein
VQGAFFAEFRRRRVVRALLAYGIAAFAVLQIVEPVMHGLHWPDAVLSYVVVALAAGFPIVIAVAWTFDVAGGTAGRPTARTAVVIAAVAVVAAAPGVAWFLLRKRPPPPGGETPSIAVIPLVNLSSDKEQDYFSDGLTEELLDLLAKVPGLHVAARTSTFAFKGRDDDIATIAEKLHVGTVLEGSVRKSGDRIRITTQLINAADGFHLWSETYDRKLTDVFAVQDEIAEAVVSTLRLKLLPKSVRRTASPDAYNAFLLGRQFNHQGSQEGWANARTALEKAVSLDPGYAAAWAELAVPATGSPTARRRLPRSAKARRTHWRRPRRRFTSARTSPRGITRAPSSDSPLAGTGRPPPPTWSRRFAWSRRTPTSSPCRRDFSSRAASVTPTPSRCCARRRRSIP